MKSTLRIALLLIALSMFFGMPMPAYASGAAPAADDAAIAQNGGIIALNGEIISGGVRIDAPAPYIHEGTGAIMLPLRAVAVSIGYSLVWVEEESKIILGYGIELWIGTDHYIRDVTFYNQLCPAPELAGGRTFVPLDFLKNALEHDIYVSGGSVIIGEDTSPYVWVSRDGTAVWFAKDAPYSHCSDLATIQAGKNENGADVFALLRIPLRGAWLADEVSSARLLLKVAEGGPLKNLNIGAVEKGWAPATADRESAAAVFNESSFILTEVIDEGGGWASMDVTAMVKSWLGNEIKNRGFVLSPGDCEGLGVFVSGTPDGELDFNTAPRIVVEAQAGERSDSYGRFGFTKQPGQGVDNPIYGGNCLSYALRDIDMIIFEDLPYSFDELNEMFFESGLEAVLDYTAEIIEGYIEANKEKMQITNFRRIDGFDSPIDAGKEYRIVLRVSAEAKPELPMSERGGYDFHLWAQLSDGRWAQKTPSVFSSIIPGTGPGISPLKFYWDAGDLWGAERWQDWYKSSGIFYAVAKGTDEFTSHKN